MKLRALTLHPYAIPLTHGGLRLGHLLCIQGEDHREGWGDIAPWPNWSGETLAEAVHQIQQRYRSIIAVDWVGASCLQQLQQLQLLPSVTFALESALLALLSPLPAYSLATSALLMGSPTEIWVQAQRRHRAGYRSAKLKVGHLSLADAARVISRLKNHFRLRIDVNRAWDTADALAFFDQFPTDAFDYVEEPFRNPRDLALFRHPVAVDESFPHDLSLDQLARLPALKALIYKPTIQGGLLACLPLKEWTAHRGVKLVVSSSFESDLGLAHVAAVAHRLALKAPIGIGTYDYLTQHLCEAPLQFVGSQLFVSAPPRPRRGISNLKAASTL